LAAVEDGYRQPKRVTFGDFAHRFQHEYLRGRNLKHSTVVNYEVDLRRHLVPFFGPMEIAQVAATPELIDQYITEKTRSGPSPKTITNHLIELNVMFKVALRWGARTV
jgi:site-specific recombinase XerD